MIYRLLLIGLTSLVGWACQPIYKADRQYQVYEKGPEFFENIVNSGDTDSNSPKIVLEDSSYPIKLQLFKDGTFHYELKKLGDGWGEWTHKDGHLELYAERKLFVMNFALYSTEEQGSSLSLEFSDRFGPKFLTLEQKVL